MGYDLPDLWKQTKEEVREAFRRGDTVNQIIELIRGTTTGPIGPGKIEILDWMSRVDSFPTRKRNRVIRNIAKEIRYRVVSLDFTTFGDPSVAKESYLKKLDEILEEI